MGRYVVLTGASLAVKAALLREGVAVVEPDGPSATATLPPFHGSCTLTIATQPYPTTGKRKAQWKAERRGRR